jgi:hypothetical protein
VIVCGEPTPDLLHLSLEVEILTSLCPESGVQLVTELALEIANGSLHKSILGRSHVSLYQPPDRLHGCRSEVVGTLDAMAEPCLCHGSIMTRRMESNPARRSTPKRRLDAALDERTATRRLRKLLEMDLPDLTLEAVEEARRRRRFGDECRPC